MQSVKRPGPAPDRTKVDEVLYNSLRAIYRFERSLVERFGLDYQGVCLLQILRRRESARIGELAEALSVPVFSASRAVQRLEAAGYLGKERVASDKRAIAVSLEPAGERLLSDIERHSYDLILERMAGRPSDERKALLLAAEHLGEVLGVEDEGTPGAS